MAGRGVLRGAAALLQRPPLPDRQSRDNIQAAAVTRCSPGFARHRLAHHKERNMAENLETRMAQLEDDLGRVALLTRALMDAILKKGVLTQMEIAEMMTKADLSDGERDGKLDLRSLRQRPPE